MSIARSIVVTTLLLLLAAPSQAQPQAKPQAQAVNKNPERTALPSKGLVWGSKMTVEALPCCAVPNGKLPDKDEAAALAKLAGHAWRDNDILKLELEGGHSLKITDCDDETACEADRFRKHRLVAWLPASRLYVVNVPLYEGSLAYLIAHKDGRTTQVAAPPVLSPSGQHAIALQSNLMTGVVLNVIDLAAVPPKVVEVEAMPTCAGFGPNSFLRPTPVWVDESHVRFDGVSPQPGDNASNKQLLRIGAGAPKWEC
jgi:hypothetical protein